MRVNTDAGPRTRPRRRSLFILIGIIALIVAVIVVQGLAGFYANFLWFHWSGVGAIWGKVTASKVLLAVVFIALAFVLLWGCLFLVDVVARRAVFIAPDTELVRRYQAIVAPHAFALRTVVSFLLALALGSSTAAQWQNWLLYTHAVPFGMKDPAFHRDISFFVFRFPFLSFLVDWIFGALIVAFIVTTIAYFLNGAIRLQGNSRIEPRALAHLSLLLGLMALERAWAYFFVDRFGLDLSKNGFVAGASYTDVHVRVSAMELMAIVSLAAFAMLIFNVYERNWVLPTVAVGLWCFLAIAIGVIYPALVQALRVTPAQSSLEKPYIERNIAATQHALGIAHVAAKQFPANQDLTPGVLQQYSQTLDDAQVWDPIYSASTFQRLQAVLSYYKITNLTVDRYMINGKLTPVIVGVRALNTSGLPSQSWVNTHLQYTHGEGAIAVPANTAIASGSSAPASNTLTYTPNFALGNIPPTATSPDLALSKPAVYYAPGDDQYVMVDTQQAEFGSQANKGSATHYNGGTGIPVGSFISRAAFAIHLRDFNLLISNLITSKSKLIYIPDARTAIAKALPFLKVDTNPYAVIDHGQLEWVVDAYTSTPYYPYGQPADTSALPQGSGLSGTYNYVRDAVKVVMNAYTGKMQFYAIDPKGDPLMQSYMLAFPNLFQPLSKMDAVLRTHLRYPQDLLTVQATMYGRYHVPANQPSVFYSQSQAWNLSETSSSESGSPSSQLATNFNGTIQRYQPIYELLQLPGESSSSFDAIEPLVPYSVNDRLRTLRALLAVKSDWGKYGEMTAYVTPSNQTIDGPGLANATILADPVISQKITLLDQGGSTVSFGTVQVLPIADSLLYVRPLFVSSSQTSYPLLVDVVVVYGKQVGFEPTLAGALADVFGTSINNVNPSQGSSGGSPTTSIPSEVRSLLAQAAQDYKQAQAALGRGDLGGYQNDVEAAGQLINQANSLFAPTASKTPKAKAKTAAHAAAASRASAANA